MVRGRRLANIGLWMVHASVCVHGTWWLLAHLHPVPASILPTRQLSTSTQQQQDSYGVLWGWSRDILDLLYLPHQGFALRPWSDSQLQP
eukprot:COSAG02_NODE_43531_length_374_cov_0.483636_1_plen_88_part_01